MVVDTGTILRSCRVDGAIYGNRRYIFFLILAILGLANWLIFFSLLLLVYAFATCTSVYAIFNQNFTLAKYESVSDLISLVTTAMLESFFYHPRAVNGV